MKRRATILVGGQRLRVHQVDHWRKIVWVYGPWDVVARPITAASLRGFGL